MSELDRLLESETSSQQKPADEGSATGYGAQLLQSLIRDGVIGSWSRVEDTETIRDEIRQARDEAMRTKLR
jgi:hypothetical protein